MGKQIPLVLYANGTRFVLGMASIQKDGEIIAQVQKDHWPSVKGLFDPKLSELTINHVAATPVADVKTQE